MGPWDLRFHNSFSLWSNILHCFKKGSISLHTNSTSLKTTVTTWSWQKNMLADLQLVQIRTAFAIALLLNRTLVGRAQYTSDICLCPHFKSFNSAPIDCRSWCSSQEKLRAWGFFLFLQIMPSMWCRFDRMWYGHKGILDGTKTSQPFLCPLDHVFDVQILLLSLSSEWNVFFNKYSDLP